MKETQAMEGEDGEEGGGGRQGWCAALLICSPVPCRTVQCRAGLAQTSGCL